MLCSNWTCGNHLLKCLLRWTVIVLRKTINSFGNVLICGQLFRVLCLFNFLCRILAYKGARVLLLQLRTLYTADCLVICCRNMKRITFLLLLLCLLVIFVIKSRHCLTSAVWCNILSRPSVKRTIQIDMQYRGVIVAPSDVQAKNSEFQ
jgi:hypothetical protein